jgi:hypothetical protein
MVIPGLRLQIPSSAPGGRAQCSGVRGLAMRDHRLGATRQAPVVNERIFDTDNSMVATFDITDAVPTFPGVPLQIGEGRLDSSTVSSGICWPRSHECRGRPGVHIRGGCSPSRTPEVGECDFIDTGTAVLPSATVGAVAIGDVSAGAVAMECLRASDPRPRGQRAIFFRWN